ncbi:hypothetical protein B0H17DRAFT_1058446 [Mycena rosella]|uniref:EthD domain-containing protein n=1 Tax=Mycena rosella TaxID=1033263 RepID=A0AAD7GGH8_MYCRO|nr:hypothetical protein B0H17DRAFT_1058446 [Mycena rosella]
MRPSKCASGLPTAQPMTRTRRAPCPSASPPLAPMPGFSKDRFRLAGFFPAPAHLSRAEFKHHFEKLVDAIVASSVGQKNILHYDLLFSNNDLDSHTKELGFNETPLAAVILVETQTYEGMQEILHDPLFRQILAGHNGKLNFTSGQVFTGELLGKVAKSRL